MSDSHLAVVIHRTMYHGCCMAALVLGTGWTCGGGDTASFLGAVKRRVKLNIAELDILQNLKDECLSRPNILNSNEYSRRVSSSTCDERPWPHVCPASWWNALWVPYKSIRTLLSNFLPYYTQGTFHWRTHTVLQGIWTRIQSHQRVLLFFNTYFFRS